MYTCLFMKWLKRFACQRGLPRKFISDNAKTFKTTSRYIKAVFRDCTIEKHLAGLGCVWKFKVERAPWWGEDFERLIKSTKCCLRKTTAQGRSTHNGLYGPGHMFFRRTTPPYVSHTQFTYEFETVSWLRESCFWQENAPKFLISLTNPLTSISGWDLLENQASN